MRFLDGNSYISKAVIFIALVSLLFSVTNVVPISAAIFCGVILIPFLLFKDRPYHQVALSTLVMLGYFAVSAIIYNGMDVLSYDFLRRDGNVFITYGPLLMLALMRIRLDVGRIVQYFVYFATGVNVVFMGIYYATGGTIFYHEKGIYHFLFEAHNAAGGFLSILTALSFGLYVGTKRIPFLIMALLNGFSLYISNSRGSIVAVVAAILIYFFFKGKREKIVIILLVLGQLVLLGYLFQNKAPAYFTDKDNFGIPGKKMAFQEMLSRSGTIVNRGFYLWPRGMQLFFDSPIVGTGFGSYNDLQYDLKGVKGVFMYNANPKKIFSDAHAHHSFIHIAAETGIIGLGFLFWMLWSVKRYIHSITSLSLQAGLFVAFWVNIFSSLTEHRLVTPSQMIPFVIVLGLSIASSRLQNVPTITQNNSTETAAQ